MPLTTDQRANEEYFTAGLKGGATTDERLADVSNSDWEFLGATAAQLARERLFVDRLWAAMPRPGAFAPDERTSDEVARDALSEWPLSHARGEWVEVEDFASRLRSEDVLRYGQHEAGIVMMVRMGERFNTVTLDGLHWPLTIPNNACVTFYRLVEDDGDPHA